MITEQFKKFVVIGVFSTIVNYFLFYVLHEYLSVSYLLSSAAGFVAGVFAGYGFNKHWTFGAKEDDPHHIIKYFAVYSASLAISLVILELLVAVIGLNPKLANVLVIGVTTCTNFIGTKFLVFKK